MASESLNLVPTRAADRLIDGEARLGRLIASLPGACVLTHDREHRVTSAGGTLLPWMGWRDELPVGRTPAQLLPTGRAEVWTRHLERTLAGGSEVFQWRACRGLRELEVRTMPLVDRDGEVGEALFLGQDVTERKRLVDRLRDHEAQLRLLVETAPDAILGIDAKGRIVLANPRVEQLLGYRPEEVVGQPLDLLVPERVRTAHAGHRARYAERPQTRPMGAGRDLRALRKDGEEVPVEISLAATATENGPFTTAVIVDVSERRRAEAALRDSEERFRQTFEYAPIGVALVGLKAHEDGRFLQVNPALCAMTGYSKAELEQLTYVDLAHPEELEADAGALRDLAAGHSEQLYREKRYLRRDGEEIWVQVRASGVPGPDGRPQYNIVHIQDITDRKRREEKLREFADHDALTGLFNRRRFEEELARTLASAERHGEPAALLLVDLDDFKAVNDAHGHAVGDELLIRVAGSLRARLRETDVVARLGGDEFAVILSRVDERRAAAVAGELVGSLAAACAAGGDEHPIRATASIGVALIAPGIEANAEDLLVRADLAMYSAKEAGRNRVVLADAADAQRHELRARMRWAQRIERALDEDGFVLMRQPIFDLARRQVDRHELLLRMRDDDGQLVPPGAFLDVAERSGQVRDIDRWVVSQALRLLEELRRTGRADVLEVNLSGATLTDTATMDAIVREVAAADIDHRQLVLEVTETAAIGNMDRAREFAGRLSALGCQFALDDFGAGFGSFYYLKHLPFDCLKIDGDFIRELTSSHSDQLTVKAIVDIARGLGKRTIAEYVEDAPTLELLGTLGVDYAQGYHVGRPQPLG